MSIKRNNIHEVRTYGVLDFSFVTNPKYKNIKLQHMALFGILKNQESLSLKTAEDGDFTYIDRNGDVFIIFNQELLARIAKISVKTLYTYLDTLASCGLIEIVRQADTSKPNKMYLAEPEFEISYAQHVVNNKKDIKKEKEKEEKEEKEVIRLKPKPNKSKVGNKTKNPLKSANDRGLTNKSATNTTNINFNNHIVTKNDNNVNGKYKKTRFHNLTNESFRNYDPDELEEMLKENQKGKFK